MSIITWLGHAAFKLRADNLSILVDPFFTSEAMGTLAEEGGVDLVLITHDHADHTGSVAEIVSRTNARVGCIVGTGGHLAEMGVPQENILHGGFNMGGTIGFKGCQVTMTPAFHTSQTGSPAGYIIRMPDGLTIYHAGDTCVFSGMALWGKLYPIDVALLPIGGHYTMDARQAVLACGLLKCQNVVPMHWGTFPIIAQDTSEFEELLEKDVPSCRCIPLKVGESADFSI